MFYHSDDNESLIETSENDSDDDEQPNNNEQPDENEHDDDVQILPETMYEFLTALSGNVNRPVYYSISSSIIVDDLEERMLNEAIVESQNTPQPTTKKVMNMDDFKSLETYVYVGGSETKECPITMVEFEDGDNIVVLPCKHEFIRESIQQWVTKECANCPVCRHSLPSHNLIDFPN